MHGNCSSFVVRSTCKKPFLSQTNAELLLNYGMYFQNHIVLILDLLAVGHGNHIQFGDFKMIFPLHKITLCECGSLVSILVIRFVYEYLLISFFALFSKWIIKTWTFHLKLCCQCNWNRRLNARLTLHSLWLKLLGK